MRGQNGYFSMGCLVGDLNTDIKCDSQDVHALVIIIADCERLDTHKCKARSNELNYHQLT